MPVPQFEVHQKMAILFGHGASHTKFKAEIKLSGERVAARFACGAESLAVYRAVYKYIASRCRRGATKARFPLPHVRQITSICSRAGHVNFPRVSLTGILELDTLSSIIYSW